MVTSRTMTRHRFHGVFSHEVVAFLIAGAVLAWLGALFTDMTYVSSPDIQWSNFSAWLLAFGMMFSGLAGLAALYVFIRAGHWRWQISEWVTILAGILAMVVAFINNLVHTHDSWTSVWPTGLALSVITVGLCLVAIIARFFTTRNIFQDNIS